MWLFKFSKKNLTKEDFLKWIEAKDYKIIKEYINNNDLSDIKITTNDWKSIFNIFCEYWNLEIVNLLITKWIDINEEDSLWTTPLTSACSELNTEIIEILIENWADINIKNNEWISPLELTCLMISGLWKPRKKIISLLNNNINDFHNKWDIDKFLSDQIESYIKIIKLLLENWADIHVKDQQKWNNLLIETCFYWSRNRSVINDMLKNPNWIMNYWNLKPGNAIDYIIYEIILELPLKIIKLLIENWIDINYQNNIWNTALIESCYEWDKGIIKTLIDNWAKINVQNNIWDTALMKACRWTSPFFEIVKFLIENWANPNVKNNEWETAVDYANEYWNTEIVEFILSQEKFKFNSPDKQETELLNSINNRNTEKTKSLINDWINLNSKDQTDNSPLILACIKGELEIVKLLIEKWVDIDTKDNNWLTALAISYKYWQNKIADFLIKSWADVNVYIDWQYTILHNKILEWDIKTIKILIENWADINAKENLLWVTWLMLACVSWDKEMVKTLIENWADPNIKDNDWRTALSIASKKWNTKIIEIISWSNQNNQKEDDHNIIFLDIETQKSKDDVSWRYPEKMLLALAVTFDATNWYRTWYENDVDNLISELGNFSSIVWFNVIDFDYGVLMKYDNSIKNKLSNKTIDMLNDIYKKLWFRIKLDDLVKTTLWKWKSWDWLQSINWRKNGEYNLVAEYCKKDVLLTKELYEFWKNNWYINYNSYWEKKKINVDR